MTSYDVRGAQRLWWVFALRGGLLALFGLIAIIQPGAAATALVTIYGIYSILDGFIAIGFGSRASKASGRSGGWYLQGAFMILIGIIALIWPAAIAAAVLLIAGFWTIVVGLVVVAIALRARKAGAPHWFWLLALGALALVIGLIMVFQPVASALTFLSILGIFALVGGIMLVVAGFRMKSRAA